MEKSYDPKIIEDQQYNFWLENGYFHSEVDLGREPFSIVVPPPNVTGSLHVGHALDHTLQDIVIRWQRMRGRNTVWIPGTDHAGIATQIVVERELAKDGINRLDIGRDAFVEHVWKWKQVSRDRITSQIRKIGDSCDWERERFTMDEGLSRAVREAFVRLYNDGLIYKDEYIVNWCPRCKTALSDLEVRHDTRQSQLYFIDYPLADGTGSITVATTRPETMLGDTAVAVHPEDERYASFVGKTLLLPLLNREIPVVADPFVDREFGTGAVKLTPAHDPNDYQAAKRNNLPAIHVINGDGVMTAAAGPYAGLDRFAARKRVLADLKEQSRLVREEKHQNAIGICDRCKTVVEPLLSPQWFVRMESLAKPAIEAVEDGRIRFYPDTWSKTYFEWMRNIHDWCISRQIWWGHRIPAWRCADCSRYTVSVNDPDACTHCGSKEIIQESDVLDTWFSSGLWPFSVFGWPEETPELKYFYPTNLLVTGFDIIFFWVARMIMFGMKFMGDVPFRGVYIHGLVRDEHGQKMSKSRGNTLDPLDLIEEYGADSLRFTLATLSVPSPDIPLAPKRLAGYRAFLNKLWNSIRFALMKVNPGEDLTPLPQAEWTLADRWIESRFRKASGEINSSLEECRFDLASNASYRYLWHEFCDWYIEWIKPELSDDHPRASARKGLLFQKLYDVLTLLHPFVPFVTEYLWQELPEQVRPSKAAIIARYPEPVNTFDDEAEQQFGFLMELIGKVRQVRTEMNVEPSRKIKVMIKTSAANRSLIQAHEKQSLAITRAEAFEFVEEFPSDPLGRGVCTGAEIGIVLHGALDLDVERERLKKELRKIEVDLKNVETKLANENFVKNAPAEVVAEQRSRFEDLSNKKQKAEQHLQTLG